MDANTKVPELLSAISKEIDSVDDGKYRDLLKDYYSALQSSVLFRLDGETVNHFKYFRNKYRWERCAKFISDFIPEFKLPYESCTLEVYYRCKSDRNTSWRVLVTASQTQTGLNNDEDVKIYAGFKLHNNPTKQDWRVCEGVLHLTACGFAPLFAWNGYDVQNVDTMSCTDVENMEKLYTFFLDQMDLVLFFMAIMACKNTVAVKKPVSGKVNQKRTKKGKLPLYTYHELQVTPGETGGSGGKGTGTKQGPRVHLRRGHIRRLPQGNIWVNACVVGNKEKGIVHKHYKVNKPA